MNELIVIEKKNVLSVFTEEGTIDPLLDKIAKEARAFVGDVGTAKGRKEIASMAYKVAQTKVYLDTLGKDLVSEMKELPRKVDASRKIARDFLDNLRDEIRAPLDAWEAEQARIESERKAAEEAAALAKQIENDHEMALLMDAEFNRQLAAKAEAEAKERAEHERLIAEQAAAQAKAEIEARAKAEVEAAERKALEAQLAAERAERKRLEDIEAAAVRAKEAEARAEREKQAAVDAERRRAEEEAKAERAAAEAREADKAHRTKINRAAVSGLIEHANLTDEQAKAVITAIVLGKVPNTKIIY